MKRSADGVEALRVIAEKAMAKPYLEVKWNREWLARFGVSIEEMQQFLEIENMIASIEKSVLALEAELKALGVNSSSQRLATNVHEVISIRQPA